MKYFEIRKRAMRFKEIRAEKISRIEAAIREINEWQDIPMSWLYPSICDILKIKQNDGAKRLMLDLTVRRESIETLSRRLP